jgi:iron(III) transport system substrate-binding protein
MRKATLLYLISSFGFRHFFVILVSSFGFLYVGCDRSSSPEVVLYTSVDQPYADPIVKQFEKDTGIKVRLVTDTEASKSVGLAERLRAEKSNPRCDVWWGNEPFHTISLAEEGLLQQYESPNAKEVATLYRDPERRWTGNALRARVVAVGSWEGGSVAGDGLGAFADLRFKGRVAMARPTAGTTGGHVAALYVLWGDEKADAFFKQLRANDIKLLGGNGPVADAVGRGQFVLGLTDNDDCAAVLREGGKLSMILPDQDEHGTLMIPTTVGLVSGSKQPDAAKKLVDYLLSPAVEKRLIDARFAGWSVRGPLPITSMKVTAMKVDYRAVAGKLPGAVRRATAILEGREQ